MRNAKIFSPQYCQWYQSSCGKNPQNPEGIYAGFCGILQDTFQDSVSDTLQDTMWDIPLELLCRILYKIYLYLAGYYVGYTLWHDPAAPQASTLLCSFLSLSSLLSQMQRRRSPWEPNSQFSYPLLKQLANMGASMVKHGSPHCGQCCTLWQILELITAWWNLLVHMYSFMLIHTLLVFLNVSGFSVSFCFCEPLPLPCPCPMPLSLALPQTAQADSRSWEVLSKGQSFNNFSSYFIKMCL